jgi:hypothetical protein
MSKLDDLANIIREKAFDEIEDYWAESLQYAKIRLIRTNSGYEYEWIEQRKKEGRSLKSSVSRGVYIWLAGDTVLYVGKTDSKTTNINLRQMSHLRHFVNVKAKSESSGRKLREYLEENNLQYADVEVKYINTKEYEGLGLADIIETASISHYKPMINREIKGRGSR